MELSRDEYNNKFSSLVTFCDSRDSFARVMCIGVRGLLLVAPGGVEFGFMSQGKLSQLSQLSQHVVFPLLLSCDSSPQLSQSVARGAKVKEMEGASG